MDEEIIEHGLIKLQEPRRSIKLVRLESYIVNSPAHYPFHRDKNTEVDRQKYQCSSTLVSKNICHPYLAIKTLGVRFGPL